MKLTLGFSPCPNDTFIFDALVNQKIDTEGLEFDVVMEDVETLNKWALTEKLDITKLSFPALFQSTDKYVLLNSGSALGKGAGPLLISNIAKAMTGAEIKNALIALPGENTTAHLLFSFAYPEAKNKIFMRFDKIEDFVLSESAKTSFSRGEGAGDKVLGVIIHENRFTYQQKGLHKVADLGELWEERMQLPVPLGGIAINQSIKRSVALKVNELIRKSIDLAFEKYPVIPDYVQQHAQEMSEEVMRKHIELYVNNYSLDVGEEGKLAILRLYRVFLELNQPATAQDEFLFL